MGAVFVVIEGNVRPVLLAENMEMEYNFNGQNTRILIYSMQQGQSFSGEFLMSEGRVLSIEMATYDGTPVIAKLLPDEFVLYQSYPNPFNPSTTISFNLPVASEYNLTIYNVTGQQIEVFTGFADAGLTTVEWHAGDYQASGVYFYKLTAGNYTDTKKMILLK